MILFNDELIKTFPGNVQNFIFEDFSILYKKDIDFKNLKLLKKTLLSICNPRFGHTFKVEKVKIPRTRRSVIEGEKYEMVDETKIVSESNLNNTYLNTLIDNVADDTRSKYDMVFLAKKGTPKTTHNIMSTIIAFIITEIGECKSRGHETIPVLNVVCTLKKLNNEGNLIPFHEKSGRIMFYLYIKALMEKKYTHGLLELAGNYTNTRGLCLYNKFGFREYPSIKSENCFKDGLYEMDNNENIKYKDVEKTQKISNKDIRQITLPMKVALQGSNINDDSLGNVLIYGTPIEVKNDPVDSLCDQKYRSDTPSQLKMIEERQANLIRIKDIGLEDTGDVPDADIALIAEKNGLPKETSRIDLVNKLTQKARLNEKIEYLSAENKEIQSKKNTKKRKLEEGVEPKKQTKQTKQTKKKTKKRKSSTSPPKTKSVKNIKSPFFFY